MTEALGHPAGPAIAVLVVMGIEGLETPEHCVLQPRADIRVRAEAKVIEHLIHNGTGHRMNVRVGNRRNASAAAGPVEDRQRRHLHGGVVAELEAVLIAKRIAQVIQIFFLSGELMEHSYSTNIGKHALGGQNKRVFAGGISLCVQTQKNIVREGKPFRVFAFPDILLIFKGLQNVINGLSVQVAGVAAVLHSVIPPAAAAPAVFLVPGFKRES